MTLVSLMAAGRATIIFTAAVLVAGTAAHPLASQGGVSILSIDQSKHEIECQMLEWGE